LLACLARVSVVTKTLALNAGTTIVAVVWASNVIAGRARPADVTVRLAKAHAMVTGLLGIENASTMSASAVVWAADFGLAAWTRPTRVARTLAVWATNAVVGAAERALELITLLTLPLLVADTVARDGANILFDRSSHALAMARAVTLAYDTNTARQATPTGLALTQRTIHKLAVATAGSIQIAGGTSVRRIAATFVIRATLAMTRAVTRAVLLKAADSLVTFAALALNGESVSANTCAVERAGAMQSALPTTVDTSESVIALAFTTNSASKTNYPDARAMT